MSTFLNRLSNSTGQRVEVDSTFAGTAIYHDGLAYGTLNKLVVNYSGMPAFYMAGIGFMSSGEMLVVDASGGLPADTSWQSGLPISRAQNRLCVDPINAVSYVHQGVPFTTVGAVAVDGTGPPAESLTFDTVYINGIGGPESGDFVGQLYFGTSGSATAYYSSKAAFLAAHTGLTLQDFAGIAPDGGNAAVPAFSGFSVASSDPANTHIYDDTGMTPAAPWCALGVFNGSQSITLTFSPKVNSVGFNLANIVNLQDMLVAFYDGATELHTELVNPGTTAAFSLFAGYSSAGTPP